MEILKLLNIQYKYPESLNNCLNNITFTVCNGETVGLIGPNGAGKTTLLKIICGLINEFSGDILIYGKQIQKYSNIDLAKLISYIPQMDNYVFDFTVEEIVAMGRRPYINSMGILKSHDKKIIKKVIDMLGLDKIVKKRFLNLSGGERRLTLIARALAQETEIILMDEPTSNLDLNHKIIFMNKIIELKKTGKTIILISHDINLVSEYLNRIIFIKEGKVIKDGPVNNVLNEESLREVFEIKNFFVCENKITKKPNVFFIPEKEV
ncbi:MAG: ABC transporter ATP-binding protein [Candidatus Goldbacteria bacterium]|nr:ABC transporter ATP-binding protein [Candidatus Goldiibacteriota bacterium]